MHVDDEELAEMVRNGAKVVARTPGPKEEPKPLSDADRIIEVIRNLDTTLTNLADRPTPEINVSAPQVSVKPEITVEARKEYREFEVEVTERDKTEERRIKKLRIRAII